MGRTIDVISIIIHRFSLCRFVDTCKPGRICGHRPCNKVVYKTTKLYKELLSGSKSNQSGVEQISTCIKRLMWNKFQLSSDSLPTNMFVCTVRSLHATGVGHNCSSDTFELKSGSNSGIGAGHLSAGLRVMPHKFAEDSQQLDRLFYQLKLLKCPKVGVPFSQIKLKSSTHGCIPYQVQNNIY